MIFVEYLYRGSRGTPIGGRNRTVDSRLKVIVHIRVTIANLSDVEPIPDILRDIPRRLGYPPDYMGLDAGYYNYRVALHRHPVFFMFPGAQKQSKTNVFHVMLRGND